MERDENTDSGAGVLLLRMGVLVSGLQPFKQRFFTIAPLTPPRALVAQSACRSGKSRTGTGIPRDQLELCSVPTQVPLYLCVSVSSTKKERQGLTTLMALEAQDGAYCPLIQYFVSSQSVCLPRAPGQNACALSHFSWVSLFATQWTIAHQPPLSMGFSRQQYWSGLLCPPPGFLPTAGIESIYFTSTCIDRFFTSSSTWEAQAQWLPVSTVVIFRIA